MESLYRKYRPLTFESVVGQQHIVSTLEHAVTEGRLGHAYLFCGPRGTGKTTMARILAKALLCERAEAARAEGASGCLPDGTCPACEQIAEGTHPDVYELDAASRTGVDNVREEIIGSVNFAPVQGAFKIYIIDEVHMLTTAAFNALLKTLEEPPSHVVFVLCTTDPQKIPETILSRCQRFDFHRIGNEDIVGRLRYICEQEQFGYDDEALEIVARHARGGMRDALSTLEQLSVFGNGAVHVADARALLGEVSGTVLSEICRAIAARDVPTLFGLVRTQVEAGEDLMDLTRDLVAHVRDVYVARVAGAQAELFEGTPEEVETLKEEAGLFESADRLARVLTVLDDAALEMRTAADTRLVLEIALTRLARPESDLTLEALAERVARLESQVAAGVPAAPLSAADAAALMGASAEQIQPVKPAEQAKPGEHHGAYHDVPGQGVPVQQFVPAVREAPAAAEPAASDAVSASSAASGVVSGGAAPAAATAPVAAPPATNSAASPSTGATAAGPVAGTPPAATSPAMHTSAQPASAAELAAASAAPTAAVTDEGELQRKWRDVIKRAIAAQPSRGALLQSSRAGSDDGTTLTIRFPPGSNFPITMLGRPDAQAVVLPQISAVFGARTVRYVMDEAPAGAPAAPARTAQPSPAPAAVPVAAPNPVSVPATQAAAPVPVVAGNGQSAAPATPEPSAPEPVKSDAFVAAPEVPSPASAPPAASPAPEAAATSAGPEAARPAAEPLAVPAGVPTWEDDQVPYDDYEAMAYDESLPPFDMPEESSFTSSRLHQAPSPSEAPATASGTLQTESAAQFTPAPAQQADSAPLSPGPAQESAQQESAPAQREPAPVKQAAQREPAPVQQPAQQASTPEQQLTKQEPAPVQQPAQQAPAPEQQAGGDSQPIDPSDVASVLGSVFGEEVKLTQVENPF